MHHHARLAWLSFPLAFSIACGDDSSTGETPPGPEGCDLATATFAIGDDLGHADPYGAKAAGQARAGRLKAGDVVPPAHGRQQVREGDFVLVNDKIAVVIEDKGESDGYNPFGGEILSLDLVGDDGRPRGLSQFGETLDGFTAYVVDPTSVTVMNDGSDGKAAVVRVTGPLHLIPFLAESFAGIFPDVYEGLQAAYDYVLEPGAEKVTVRRGLINASDFAIDGGVELAGSHEWLGYFQGSHTQRATAEFGFGPASKLVSYVAFDGGAAGFAYQGVAPEMLESGGIEISGFSLYNGQGARWEACSKPETLDARYEVVVGGPSYDGLREAIRRANGEPAWRAVSGVVKDASGTAVADAYVHVIGAGGAYLSRTQSDASGNYTVHAPTGEAVSLVPQSKGYPLGAGTPAPADATTLDLSFAPTGKIHVVAKEDGTMRAIPVRIQVVPEVALAPTPEAYGVIDEPDGRSHLEFSVTGDATLVVPPGQHRVIVSRGYEWELSDTTVAVTAGATTEVAVLLEHSVDTKDVMCADFHIHSWQSADSSDPVEYKVRGALADGLDIPVSSEHEWSVDFQPVIQALGATDFAFGMPAQELTTFKWGHFGVVPLVPKPDQRNNGAFYWVGKDPAEVFAAVHALPEQPMLIVNHPRSGTYQGYFREAQLNRETGKGESAQLWDENFDAIEVFNDSDFDSNRDESVADWFSMLNHGKPVVAVGSSDSHKIRTSPVGYPRTCLAVGTDDPHALSHGTVTDRARKGQSVISGGLFLSIEGPQGEAPGAIMTKAEQVPFTLTVQTPSWVALSNPTIEVIVNGVTQMTEPLLPMGTGAAQRFVNQITVKMNTADAKSWVVFHVRADGDLAPLHPGRKLFAASNPIFFE